MGENSRPTGVSVIAVFFVLTAIPSLAGTVHFIINGLAPVLSDGIGEGLFVGCLGAFPGYCGYVFYGVLALATAYGLWSAEGWSRSMAIFLSVFLLFRLSSRDDNVRPSSSGTCANKRSRYVRRRLYVLDSG